MTTPTDPTTLRTALERIVATPTRCDAGKRLKAIARAALATPAPAADEARCGWDCDQTPDEHDTSHRLCTVIPHEPDYLCHPFQPAPTPAPPTPPETEPVAARVAEVRRQQASGGGPVTAVMVSRSGEVPATEPAAALVDEFINDVFGRTTSNSPVIRSRLAAIVAAARAEVDVERLRRAVHVAGSGRFGAGWDSHAVEDLVVAIAAAYREVEP